MPTPLAKSRKQPRDFKYLKQRQMIGWLGMLLPLLVVVFSKVWPAKGVPWHLLSSISAFYYTSAAGVFVGCLFALAMFLFIYGGYEGDKADRAMGKIAGLAALGVAFFPTKVPPGFSAPAWWSNWMNTAHYLSATTLFLSFIVFALWIFRKSSAPKKNLMSLGKRQRNRVFLICGIIMVGSVIWVLVAGRSGHSIFWPEAIALVAFAVSWLVKGRAHGPIVNLIQKMCGRVKSK